MDSAKTNNHLFAIRMNWLTWLSQPVIAIWCFFVSSFMHTWSILKMCWIGMMESLNYRYWIIGTAGAAIAIFSYQLFSYIATYLYRNDIIESMKIFENIALVIAGLSIIWSIAEISKLIRYKEQKKSDMDYKKIPEQLGNGFKANWFYIIICLGYSRNVCSSIRS